MKVNFCEHAGTDGECEGLDLTRLIKGLRQRKAKAEAVRDNPPNEVRSVTRTSSHRPAVTRRKGHNGQCAQCVLVVSSGATRGAAGDYRQCGRHDPHNED